MFETVNRDQTHAIKWERYRPQGLLPMWVADMDIASPQVITEALRARADHPVYGYSHPWLSLNQSVVDWCNYRYGWAIQPEWIVWMPGVVPSFNLAVDLYGHGGKVLVQRPNYPPMLQAAEKNGCTTESVAMHWQEDRWQWDWATLTQQLADPDTHLFLLCNPMNPQGSILPEPELHRLIELCREHQVVLCSDEIHCDLILDGQPHTPAGKLMSASDTGVTLMAASKTFNVAGLGCSFAIIENDEMRQAWQQRMNDRIPYPNFMGMLAAEVAFREARDWHQALLEHLRGNRDRLAEAINALPGVRYRPQPATFLAWLEPESDHIRLLETFKGAGIMPSEGDYFGDKRCVRLNFGTGRSTLETALTQLADHWPHSIR